MHVPVSVGFLYVQDEALEYGIDWSGPSATEEVEEHVVVPDIPVCINDDQLSALSSINPLQPCDDHGKELYVATRQFVREMLEQ